MITIKQWNAAREIIVDGVYIKSVWRDPEEDLAEALHATANTGIAWDDLCEEGKHANRRRARKMLRFITQAERA